MLNFSEQFGGGSALRQRSIWTGADRLTPSLVVTQQRPFRLRRDTSPSTNSNNLVAAVHNGAVFLLCTSAVAYTSADGATLIARTVGAGSIEAAYALGGDLFVQMNNGGTRYLYRSVNNGVAWTIVASGPLYVLKAGEFLMYQYTPASSGSYYRWNATTQAFMPASSFPDGTFASQSYSLLAYNGTRYLAVAPSGINSRAAVSVDGVNFTGASTALGAACGMTHLSISRLYTLGGKFIAFGYDTTGNIAILTSTDASAWSLAATYRLPLPAGCTFQMVGQFGVEEGGMLHVPVVLKRDTTYLPTILSTSDGIAWRLHAHGYELATAPAYCELMLQPNGRLLMCGAPIETDVDNGLELYYEL